MTIPVIFKSEGRRAFARERLKPCARCPIQRRSSWRLGRHIVRVENRRFMESKGWIIALEGRLRFSMRGSSSKCGEQSQALFGHCLTLFIRSSRSDRSSIAAVRICAGRLDSAYRPVDPEQVVAEVIRAVELLEQTPNSPTVLDRQASPIRTRSIRSTAAVVVAAGRCRIRRSLAGKPTRIGEQVRRLLPRARQVATLAEAHTWIGWATPCRTR